MTAKPTEDELARATHHLYDNVDMFTQNFNVNKYRYQALPVI